MKKITIILFENDLENKEYSNRVCEKFANLPTEKVFCGTWSEILFNNEECIASISGCVNNFINNTDKTEIIFGCCRKDYVAILNKIHAEDCEIDTLFCQNLEL